MSKIPTSENQDSTAQVLDSIADGVFTVDLGWKITFFNRAAENIIGVSREEALGRRCCEVFAPTSVRMPARWDRRWKPVSR